MSSDLAILLAARDEADRISATLAALAEAFPGAPVWVADDGSRDPTATLARAAGARVVHGERGAPRRHSGVGKGGAMTGAARAALRAGIGEGTVILLCDGDLAESARELGPLVEAIERGEADLAVAAFSTRAGGGLGIALAFARWAIRRRCGLRTRAALSGQRALRAEILRELLPLAGGYGMEVGMTIDAVRAGLRVREVDLALAHRPTGRGPAGFAHRARQLADVARAYRARR